MIFCIKDDSSKTYRLIISPSISFHTIDWRFVVESILEKLELPSKQVISIADIASRFCRILQELIPTLTSELSLSTASFICDNLQSISFPMKCRGYWRIVYPTETELLQYLSSDFVYPFRIECFGSSRSQSAERCYDFISVMAQRQGVFDWITVMWHVLLASIEILKEYL